MEDLPIKKNLLSFIVFITHLNDSSTTKKKKQKKGRKEEISNKNINKEIAHFFFCFLPWRFPSPPLIQISNHALESIHGSSCFLSPHLLFILSNRFCVSLQHQSCLKLQLPKRPSSCLLRGANWGESSKRRLMNSRFRKEEWWGRWPAAELEQGSDDEDE